MKPDAGSVGPAWTQGSFPDDAPEPLNERYADGGELGRGGMGVVRVTVDEWLDREVARKRPHGATLDGDLVREARITARLDHPNIVPVLDYGIDDEGPYYTMPVVEGQALRDSLQAGPLALLVRTLATVAHALDYAHSRGVVHRDIKPDNILLGRFGEVRIVDWGVALDGHAPDTHVVGTEGYRAPEQDRGELVDRRADVYGLGRVLDDIVAHHPDTLLAAIARRATSSAPPDRYPDAGAMAEELERWLEGRRVRAHAYTSRELVAHFLRVWRAPLLLGSIATVSVTLVLFAWATTNGWERDRALRAERQTREALLQADQHLARALHQHATSWLQADARPQAEALAHRSLQLADTPDARGILMAWDGLPAPRRAAVEELPCPHFTPTSEGYACVDGERLWVDGGQSWAVDLDGRPENPVRRVVYDGETVLLIRRLNDSEVWRAGERVAALATPLSILEPVEGNGIHVRDDHRVGRLERDGTFVWSPVLCDRIEDAAILRNDLAVVCGDRLLHGTLSEGVQQVRSLGTMGSVVALLPEGTTVVGSFDGKLFSSTNGYRPEPSGVGAVHGLAVDGARVWVIGEHLGPRRWSPSNGVFDAQLPRQGSVLVEPDGVRVVGRTIEHWEVPAAKPARLTRGGNGGLAFLTADAENALLLSGNATGAVQLWHPGSGDRTPLAEGCGNVAKTGAFVGGLATAVQLGCPGGLTSFDLATGERTDAFRTAYLRSSVRDGDALLGITYHSHLLRQAPNGPLVLHELDLVALTEGDPAWALDADGRIGPVHEGYLDVRLEHPGARDLHLDAEGIVVRDRTTVTRYTLEGRRSWSWTAPRPLTAFVSDGRATVLGDVDGRVFVLGPEGRLRAQVHGHDRLVSSIVLLDDEAYSASWDGSVRRWSLAPAFEEVAPPTPGFGGLSLDEVLERPAP